MNSPLRRAKIVATIGPSSSDLLTIENLLKAGVNVFRLNFSHGEKKDHEDRIKLIRNASKNIKKPCAILQDLQGPKLRVGKFSEGGLQIEKGEEVLLRLESDLKLDKKSQSKIIPYNYEKLRREIKVGHRILMDDGNLEIVVTNFKNDGIQAQVVFGGFLKNNKGMNFPDTSITVESFTPKDREDLLFGLRNEVDFVALSFVRKANDIRLVQRFMHAHKRNIPVIAKIEMAEAIENLKDILEVTDAVMVARGDLAVEVGTAQVPILQKQIIRDCNRRGIPVITATQMLESMIQTPRPTRAEASDVANAILDGTDAVMLSAESASGKFPVLSVTTMHNIIFETEKRKSLDRLWSWGDRHHQEEFKSKTTKTSVVQAIEHAAAEMTKWLDIKAIVCVTHTGQAAEALAKFRPDVPILALTDSAEVHRRLCLIWGVESVLIEPEPDLEKILITAEAVLGQRKITQKGDLVVFTAGWPPLKHGTTNLLKVVTIRNDYSKSIDDKSSLKKRTDDSITGYRTKKAQFVLDQNLCIQCGGCVEVCPNDIFGIEDRKVYLKEANCRNCTFDDACMEICPTNAVEIIRLDD